MSNNYYCHYCHNHRFIPKFRSVVHHNLCGYFQLAMPAYKQIACQSVAIYVAKNVSSCNVYMYINTRCAVSLAAETINYHEKSINIHYFNNHY